MGAAEGLPPREPLTRGGLDLGDLGTADVLVQVQRGVDVVGQLVERRRQCDGVFHRHLGAGPDGEVGCVGGVAEEDERRGAHAVRPAGGASCAERRPARVVHQQAVSVELVVEERLEVVAGLLVARSGRLRGVELVEAGAAPRRCVGLDDEGGDPAADRVRVGREHAVRAAFVDERETFERVRRAEPDEPCGGRVEGRLQLVREGVAQQGVGTVGCDDEVEAALPGRRPRRRRYGIERRHPGPRPAVEGAEAACVARPQPCRCRRSGAAPRAHGPRSCPSGRRTR